MDLERWLETFRGPLVGLLASWGAPWGDAEDLAQDTFAEAYLGWSGFRGDPESSQSVGAYLRGIAFNLFAAWHRRRARVGLPLEDTHTSPRTDERGDERLDALRAAIDRLPKKLRAVIWMHYLNQCSVNDVASLLGEKPKIVEGRLFRARRELRRLLTEAGMTSEGRVEA